MWFMHWKLKLSVFSDGVSYSWYVDDAWLYLKLLQKSWIPFQKHRKSIIQSGYFQKKNNWTKYWILKETGQL